MKTVLILFIIAFLVYSCLFSISNIVFRDLDSGKTKVINSIFGYKSVYYKDEEIFNFLSENKYVFSEKWVLVQSIRGGLIKRDLFENRYLINLESQIKFVEFWLRNRPKKIKKLEDGTIIFDVVVSFMSCLKENNEVKLKEINKKITDIMVKEVEVSINEK